MTEETLTQLGREVRGFDSPEAAVLERVANPQADVLVTTMRPAAAARLGFTAECIAARYPRNTVASCSATVSAPVSSPLGIR